MKVGILTLTYSLNLNYGAALQAWALKKAIQKLLPSPSNEVVVLPLDQTPEEKAYIKYGNKKDIFSHLRRFFSCLNRKIRFKQKLNNIGYRYIKFEEFHKLYNFNNRKRFASYKINGETNDIDIFVIGSDWVWYLSDTELNYKPEQIDSLKSIYLGFYPVLTKPNQKRISYAASQGIVPSRPSTLWKTALNNFSSISVREKESALYFSKNGYSKTIDHVVDPTLLLDSDDLSEIKSDILIGEPHKGFIALYVLPSENVDTIRRYVTNLSKITNLPIYNLSWEKDFQIPGITALGNNFGPAEFLAGIRQSSYVVTNSFHGMVFSSLYHKRFTAFQRFDHDFRQLNLVQLLNLENRLILNDESGNLHIESDPFEYEIDWQVIDKRRKAAALSSIDFLKKELLDGNFAH